MGRKRGAAAVFAVPLLLVLLLVPLHGCGAAAQGGGLDALFAAEQKNTVDVLVLGSSRAVTGIDPVQMYREQGFTGYVLCSDTAAAACRSAELALESQSPAVLVLEANLFLSGLESIGANAVDTLESGDLPVGYHRSATPAIGKGYSPLYFTQSFYTPASVTAQPLQPLPQESLQALGQAFSLGESSGIPLAFVSFPNAAGTEAQRLQLAAIAAACEQRGAPVVDLNQMDVQYSVRFDFARDMANESHLNNQGARKLTGLLGKILAEEYALPDHRGDTAYAHWDEAVALNALDEQDAGVKNAATLPELMEKTAGERYLTFISAVGDMTMTNAGELRGFFINKHISANVFDDTDAARLWVWWDNAIYETKTFAGSSDAGQITAAPDTVTVAGRELSSALPGINVVVLEKSTGRWVHSVAWSVEQGYRRCIP